jgi:hypothetical protein
VVKAVHEQVVPALTILQSRINAGHSLSASHTLEVLRNDWCAMLAEMDAKAESSAALSEVLTVVLDTEAQLTVKLTKNCDMVRYNDDQRLHHKYQEVVLKLLQELSESEGMHQ